MAELIPRSRLGTATKTSLGDDRTLAQIASAIRERARDDLRLRHNIPEADLESGARIKRTFIKRKEEELRRTTNGAALTAMMSSTVPRNFIWQGYQGRTTVNALKMLSGTLPTRLNLHRGRTTQTNILCRRCGSTAETDLHVLNSCRLQHGLIVRRHNTIVKKVGRDLHDLGWDVQLERTISVDDERLRPDITAIKDQRCCLIDVAVPYEKNINRPDERQQEKIVKYGIIGRQHIPALQDQPDARVTVVGLAVGSAGTITRASERAFRKLGLGKRSMTSASRIALAQSAAMWAAFERRQDSP